SELAPIKYRGIMLAAGYFMYSVGLITACIVSLVALVAFRDPINQDLQTLDRVWRLIIGLGAIPAIIALYFRLSIPETPRYLIDVEREIDWTRNIKASEIGNYEYQRRSRPAQNTNHLLDMCQYFCSNKKGKHLML